MVSPTIVIVSTALLVFTVSSFIIVSISWAELLDCSASFLTSSATTAKPLPCSPALAASIAALRANKLVWSAMLFITSLAVLIPSALWLVSRIMAKISIAAWLLSSVFCRRFSKVTKPSSFKVATWSAAWFRSSRSFSSASIISASSLTFWAPCSVSSAWSPAPRANSSIVLAISSAATEVWSLIAVISSAAAATWLDWSSMSFKICTKLFCRAAIELVMVPISSLRDIYLRALLFWSKVKSYLANRSKTEDKRTMGWAISRPKKKANANPKTIRIMVARIMPLCRSDNSDKTSSWSATAPKLQSVPATGVYAMYTLSPFKLE